MKAICTECGETLDSWSEIIGGLKVMLHLRSNHPSLWQMFNEQGSDSVTTVVTTEKGTAIEIIGENVEYEEEDGSKTVTVYTQ